MCVHVYDEGETHGDLPLVQIVATARISTAEAKKQKLLLVLPPG